MKSLVQGFLTGTRGQAGASAPRKAISPRFSWYLNTSREISPLWGRIPHLSVQVPPRTRKLVRFPQNTHYLNTRAGRPVIMAAPAFGPHSRLLSGEAAMTARPVAPIIPSQPALAAAGWARLARALPLPLASPPGLPDVVYGFGRIDASGSVADRLDHRRAGLARRRPADRHR